MFQVLCCSFRMSREIVLVNILKTCVLCQGQLFRKPSSMTFANFKTKIVLS